MRRLDARLCKWLAALELLAVLGAFAQPAYAYVDPGSGLLAFQIISTTFAGMIFMLRGRVRTLLHGAASRLRFKSSRDARS